MTYKQSNKPVIHGPIQINFRIKTEKYDLIIETVGMWLEKKLNNSILGHWTFEHLLGNESHLGHVPFPGLVLHLLTGLF